MMKLRFDVFLVCGMVLSLAGNLIADDYYEVSISPKEGEAFGKADYRLWLPEGVKTVRGIIFRQHGCGTGAREFGREHANDPQWQALARRWDCALLGSQLWAPEEDCSTWTIPKDGSARAFLDALKALAEQSEHPELTTVPWAIWGHSGGAMWVSNMTYLYPSRIIAVFARSGGLSPVGRTYSRSQPFQPEDNPRAFEVPVLFCYGEQEISKENRFFAGAEGSNVVYRVGRKNSAPWTLAVHPNSEHENSNSRLLAIRYFDAVFEQRLPTAEVRKAFPDLKPLSQESSWLGNPKTFEIHPVPKVSENTSELTWLVNENFAKAWQEFSRTGDIQDTTPPPAPKNPTVEKTSEGVRVTWEPRADVESGIAEFRISHNGELVHTVKGPVVNRWNPEGYYHAWNYSDQPLQGPKFPEPVWVDQAPGHSVSDQYQISTVNQAGLESKKVEARQRP